MPRFHPQSFCAERKLEKRIVAVEAAECQQEDLRIDNINKICTRKNRQGNSSTYLITYLMGQSKVFISHGSN